MFKRLDFTRVIIRIACLAVACALGFAPASAQVDRAPGLPAENPPAVQAQGDSASFFAPPSSPGPTAPTSEWTYHKTGDNLHPDGREQQVVWLMNRARANPALEGAWLATSSDPDIAGGRNYFHVNTTMLQNEFNGYAAKPPAAFDSRLYNAAKAHSDYMISVNQQTHDWQYEKVQAEFNCGGGSGYIFRGSIFAYADSALNAHAAWNIDWGYGTGGMQDPRGHRMAVMSLDGDYTNIGVALVYEGNPATQIGKYVTTANYCHAGGSPPAYYNQFIVGAVFWDMDGDNMYDPGEGKGGVTVTPNAGTFYAITSNSGGYAIPVTMSPGGYQVDFVGGAIDDTKDVTIGSVSVTLDYLFTPVFTDFVYLPAVRK